MEWSNLDSYLPTRIDEVAVVETHLIKNAEAGGVRSWSSSTMKLEHTLTGNG